MEVGSVKRGYWPDFMSAIGLDSTQRIPSGGSRQYQCVNEDGQSFMLYASFGSSRVHVSANSQREYVRRLMKSVNPNGPNGKRN